MLFRSFFFVSGSISGSGTADRKSVFGGDVRISGTLAVGTGSVYVTSNDIQFGDSGTRIEKAGNDLRFFDGNNTGGKTLSDLAAGGGGGGGSITWIDGGNKLVSTSSVSVDSQSRYAGQVGSDVFFFVSGSISGSGTDDNKTVFGGDVRISGSLAIDRKSTRLNSSHVSESRMPSSA